MLHNVLATNKFTLDSEKGSQELTAPTFSTPDHPSIKFLEKQRKEIVKSHPPPYAQHDPHNQPVFTADTLTHPILYLPPLISSLPKLFESAPIPSDRPPMITETRLPDIDPVSLSLHKALHYFQPHDDKYASRSYADAFNWSGLELPIDEEREWYCVAFRSKRKEGSDGTRAYTYYFVMFQRV